MRAIFPVSFAGFLVKCSVILNCCICFKSLVILYVSDWVVDRIRLWFFWFLKIITLQCKYIFGLRNFFVYLDKFCFRTRMERKWNSQKNGFQKFNLISIFTFDLTTLIAILWIGFHPFPLFSLTKFSSIVSVFFASVIFIFRLFPFQKYLKYFRYVTENFHIFIFLEGVFKPLQWPLMSFPLPKFVLIKINFIGLLWNTNWNPNAFGVYTDVVYHTIMNKGTYLT